jgi:hypothetical protein
MAKSFSFETITLTSNGEIFLKMQKLSSDGDILGKHYVCFYPGIDPEQTAADANVSIIELGFGQIPTEFVSRVKAISATVWTQEVIAAYQQSLSNNK